MGASPVRFHRSQLRAEPLGLPAARKRRSKAAPPRIHHRSFNRRTRASVPHLFEDLADLTQRLRSATRVILLLDLDGTLVPLRSRPAQVSLDSRTRQLLAQLARDPNVDLWIISGRRLADLRGIVGLKEVKCLGLHGCEGRDYRALPPCKLRLSQRVRKLFENSLAGLPSVWIEHKGPIFVVHYRGAPADSVRNAKRIVGELMERFQADLRLMPGKKIWEILPKEFPRKGDAAAAIAAQQPAGSAVIYMGDDVTDESAFKALPDAITVRVGRPAQTAARFRLRNPAEVLRFLRMIERELGRSSP
jgi:trehalose 6-phosphate phosphatase